MKTIKVTSDTYEQYKLQIIDMESACFEGNLLFTDEEIRDMVLAGDNIFWEDNNKLIAGTYYQPINTMTDEDFYDEDYGCQFHPLEHKHQDAIYINSTAILPEYRNKGLIDEIKITLLDELRANRVKYVIGHAHDGKMWHINQKYGGEAILKYDDWYGEGKHYLYEINLFKQHNDYCCAAYALWCWASGKGFGYISPYSLIKELPCREDDGTSYLSLTNYLNSYMLNSIYTSDYSELSDMKFPCIVNYQYEGDGHYGVALGFDGSLILLYNPATGETEKMNKYEFYNSWYSNRYGKRFLLK